MSTTKEKKEDNFRKEEIKAAIREIRKNKAPEHDICKRYRYRKKNIRKNHIDLSIVAPSIIYVILRTY